MTMIISGTDSHQLHGRGSDGPWWGLIVTVQKHQSSVARTSDFSSGVRNLHWNVKSPNI